MNKFLTKIIGASLAIAMMIGVGVVANNKEATEVSAAASDTTKYQLINSVEDLETGKSYILTSGTSGTVKAAAVTSNNNNRKTTNATVDSSGKIARGSSILSFTLGGTSGAWTFLTENYAGTNGYFASATSGSNNYLRVIPTTSEENHAATISFSGDAAVINIQPHSSRKLVRYNSSSDCFACYSSGQNPVYLFKEVAGASAYVTSVSATIRTGTYYAGDTLSASDFIVTASWSEGDDTHPEADFTWTVNGVLNGTLALEQNTIVVTFDGVNSDPIYLTGNPRPAASISLDEETIVLDAIGETATLTATVLPDNTTDTVVWSSDNEAVATVTDGVVTAVAAGNATITATAGSVNDTCEVTVRNNAKVIIDFTDGDAYQVVKPVTAQTEITNTTINGYELNLLNASNNNGANAYLMFNTKDVKTDNSLLSNKKPVPGAITKIVFTTTNGASTSAKYYAMLSEDEVTTAVSDNTNSLTGRGSITITAAASDNYHFFAISSVLSSANGQLASITIFYEPSSIKGDVEALETKASLSYTYNAPVSNPNNLQNVAIRFGGFIEKSKWNTLNKLYKIEGYGVMLTTASYLQTDTIKEDYEVIEGLTGGFDDAFEITNGISYLQSTEIKNFYNTVSTAPAEEGNNYFWNLYKGINSTEIGLAKDFVAAAYIKTTYGGVVFLDEISKSAAQLASEMNSANPELDATLDGSLSYLASLYQAN